MKRILLYVLALLVSLCACGQVPAEETSGVSDEESTSTWQEQYDLGVRYLSEGNYREAIIAFTAAIEIDPKQAQAYVGRGDAYIGSGETEENLSAAQMDYEKAIELDETDASAWLGLADVYIRQGNYDRAEEVLRQALEKTGNDQSVADKLAEFASEKITDSQGRERKTIWRLPDGSVESYSITNYDNQNRRIKELYYQADGTLEHYNVITYRDNGFMKEGYDADGNYLYSEDHIDLKGDSEFYSRVDSYDSTGTLEQYALYGHNKTEHYDTDGTLLGYEMYEYNEAGKRTKWLRYDRNGNLYGYYVTEYDADGNRTRYTHYDANGKELSYIDYSESAE